MKRPKRTGKIDIQKGIWIFFPFSKGIIFRKIMRRDVWFGFGLYIWWITLKKSPECSGRKFCASRGGAVLVLAFACSHRSALVQGVARWLMIPVMLAYSMPVALARG